jgi:hypothetical protein
VTHRGVAPGLVAIGPVSDSELGISSHGVNTMAAATPAMRTPSPGRVAGGLINISALVVLDEYVVMQEG